MTDQTRTEQMQLDPDVERTILTRTIQKSQPGTGLSVLLFRRVGQMTPWLQIDTEGRIVRLSIDFRRNRSAAAGERVIGFTHTPSPGVATWQMDVHLEGYLAGESVLGLHPVVEVGPDTMRLRPTVTATAGRTFTIVPPSDAVAPRAVA